jgi:hypothetical protein
MHRIATPIIYLISDILGRANDRGQQATFSYSSLAAKKQNPTLTMTAPLASPESGSERDNEPSVNDNHHHSEHSQEAAFQRVQFGLTKQANRADTNCNTEAAN